MKLRRIALTTMTICLLAACGAEETLEAPPPVAHGTQGPGTSIPEDRDDDRDAPLQDLGTWIGGKGYTG